MFDQTSILGLLDRGARSYLRPLFSQRLISNDSSLEFELILRTNSRTFKAFRGTEPLLREVIEKSSSSLRLKTQLDNCLTSNNKWAGLDLTIPPIMGIVNVTPDSFSDGGDFAKSQTAIDHGIQLSTDGASILDVGGESTRPGASKPTIDEELARILPVIGQLTKLGHIVSVDTRRTEVMKAAVEAGAQIINDVSALLGDADSFAFVAQNDLPVVLMHMQGTPETMQKAPTYDQVVLDVYDFLEQRVQACLDAGLDRENIALDPGIGFGKTIDHNLSLINNLSVFKGLGCPILIGLSRKAFIGKLSGAGEAKDRMAGTVAANLESIRQGASLLRVHDVKENVQAVKIHKALESNSF